MSASTMGEQSSPFRQDAETQQHFRRQKILAAVRRSVLPTSTIALLFLIWEWSVWYFAVPSYIAPSPSMIGAEFAENWSMFLRNTIPTAIEAVSGFVLGGLLGVGLAILFVRKPLAEEAFFPLLIMISAIPMVAKAPILVLLMGNGMEPKITIAVLVCFFPTLVYMVRGLRQISPEHIELMKILSASDNEVLFKLRLKAALPHLFSALKLASSACVIGAIIGEWIGSNSGIGSLIVHATYNFDSPMLYATVFIGALMASGFYVIVSAVERRMLKWNVESSD